MSDLFKPRRAAPGQAFGFTDREGNQRTLKADDDGVVRPETIEAVRVLDGMGLPVARVAEKKPSGSKARAPKAKAEAPAVVEPVVERRAGKEEG